MMTHVLGASESIQLTIGVPLLLLFLVLPLCNTYILHSFQCFCNHFRATAIVPELQQCNPESTASCGCFTLSVSTRKSLRMRI